MTFTKDPEQNETKHLYKFADIAGKRVLEIGCGEGRLGTDISALPLASSKSVILRYTWLAWPRMFKIRV